MEQIDRNFNNMKAFSPIEKALKKAEEEVVEETITRGAEGVQQNTPKPKGVKVDPLQFLEQTNQDMLSGVQRKAYTPVETTSEKIIEENNIFVPKQENPSLRDGITTPDFQALIAQWEALDENASYEDKDSLMSQIIAAAEAEAAGYEAGSEEYTQWVDTANEWRCYRFIMRNNYRLQMYENLRQQLNQGTISYEDLFDDPNEWQHLYLDMTRYFCSEDEEDFRTTNPIYDANGHLIGYEYDEQGFQYFGGKTVKVNDGPPPVYVYEQNDDPYQRFLYNEAMIASFKVKIMAIQIRLHDSTLSSSARAKLNKDLNDYRRLLQGHLEEQKNLAVDLHYMEHEEGTLIYSWNEDEYPDHGLIPGLTPPAQVSNPEPPAYMSDEFYIGYNTLKAEYKNMSGASVQAQEAILNQLLEYAAEGYNDNHLPDATFWQSEMLHWQQILETLVAGRGTESAGGRGDSGFRGNDPTPENPLFEVTENLDNIFVKRNIHL